jgi:predicted NBD/HSP70 family sugar kinase
MNGTLEIGNMNRSMTMQLIFKQPGITRAELAKAMGLTGAAVSKIVQALLDIGVIRETGYVAGGKGRRAIGLEVNTHLFNVLAFRISRREIDWGLFDLSTRKLETGQEPLTPSSTQEEIIGIIKEHIDTYLSTYNNIKAISIAAPGPFDMKSKKVLGVTGLGRFNRLDLSELESLDLPVPVYFIHDAHAGVMAEWLNNAEYYTEEKTLAYYYVDEGVGAGVISDGQINFGQNGMACEIGHVSIDVNGPACTCGNFGCLELYSSALSFLDRALLQRKRYPTSLLNSHEDLKVHDVFDAAQAGDELAIRLVREVGRYIGYGAVILINAFDPSEIVIGGLMAGGGQMLLDEVTEVANARSFANRVHKLTIRLEEEDKNTILVGAASMAIDNLLKNVALLHEEV